MTRVRLYDLIGFAFFFSVAALLGRLAVLPGTELALVWPAVGVAAAWLAAFGWDRWLVLDLALVFVLSGVINVATGTGQSLGWGLAFAYVVQLLVFGLLISRWCPQWWGFGAEPPPGIDRLTDFGTLLLAAFLSALASAALGPAAVISVADSGWESVVAWVLRNGVGVVVIFPLALLARHLVRSDQPFKRPDAVGPMRGGPVELAALTAVTAVSFWLVLIVGEDAPVSFLLLSVCVWAGARYPLGIASVHAIAVSAAATIATVQGAGPFIYVDDPYARSVVLQSFVAMVVLITLALSVGRGEILALSEKLVRSERMATEQAAMVGTIVDTMADGVSVIDGTGTVVLRNPAAQKLVGDPKRDAEGHVDMDAYGLRHLDGSPLTDEDNPAVLALTGRAVEKLDLVFGTASGAGIRQLEVTARPLPGTDPPLVVVVFHDVTAERRERDELASFAGVVAHDLLNPLTVIDGWSEALLEEARAGTPVDAETRVQRLDRIQRAAQRMQHFINDLLAFTTARDLTIRPVRVELSALVGDVARARVDASRVRGLPEPVITSDPDLPAVLAEPVLLRQVVDNLIGNSVKYVAPGVQPQIEVRARRTEGRSGPMVELQISDNGIGIPEGQHQSVFGTFHRAHQEGYRGSGLGLSIVKRIAERHGGTASARDNDSGNGTTMTVSFPAAGSG